MELNFQATDDWISISDMIKGYRDAGLTKTAESLEASMTAKASLSGDYTSIEDFSKVVGKVFNDNAVETHLLMASLEAQSLDLDPEPMTNLRSKIIDK